MANSFDISTLQTTDWNEEWKHLQRIRRHADDSQFWNKRSKHFSSIDHSIYARNFLSLIDIEPDDTVFDMGCGTGSLAVPLALKGHKVVAADFSQGMLDEMDRRAKICHAKGITPLLMSWEDDWKSFGLEPESIDVCFASRSISTTDLKDSLHRLHTLARKRVCITLPTGASPRQDDTILRHCGIHNVCGKDYQYAFNILVNSGIDPSISYIKSERKDTFDTLDEACEDFNRMIDDVSTSCKDIPVDEAKEKLRTWLSQELVPNEHEGRDDGKGYPEKHYRLRTPRMITWAFLSWDK
ncbi:MAG: methyltransferase domain-containing protein [Eggerthellaceae bacterium]|jgi:ubiquinone/menaquinone biosynthesis C-methylase UbiE|nr:methyltransferase domain-containing protein [Eggerthellaceae bacterium]MCH4221475.1 methyltransferase domain-containing protein [Eggerthellaceae bacterium]